MLQRSITKGIQSMSSRNIACSLSSSSSKYRFDTVKVGSPAEYVYSVEINNPSKRNAMNRQFWGEIKQCFDAISADRDCRCVILSGAGPTAFSAGIDIGDMSQMLSGAGESEDTARRAFTLRRTIERFQEAFSSLETCLKPVIAAVHGACVGGAVDLICCADIRLASADAWFQVKEVAMGLAADVGTLQRLPRLVGSDSLARELVYTARVFPAEEAVKAGFVSSVLADKEATVAHALKLAEQIAAMSPVAVQSSKAALIYSRDHSVSDGLRMQADWNQVMLQSEDLIKSVMANIQKEKAQFAKL